MRPYILLILLSWTISGVLQGQIYIQQGLSQNRILDHHLLEGKEPLYSSQLGVLIRFHPLQRNQHFGIESGLVYNVKGYKQDLDKIYRMKFTYLSVPAYLTYQMSNKVAFEAGFEYSELIFTNIKKGLKTYNHHDLGISFKVTAFDNQPLGLYFAYTEGLIPILDYEKINAQGNFTGRIHDLRNMTFTIGIRINIICKK